MSAETISTTLFEGLDWTQVTCASKINFCDLELTLPMEVKKQDPAKSILVGNSLSPEQVVSMMVENTFQSLVQKREAHFIHDLNYSGEILLDPEHYFLEGGRNIAYKIDAELEVKFNSTSQKSEVMQKIEDFIGQFGTQNVKESGNAILEELYMNAMFDAPREATNRGQKNCSYADGRTSILRLFKAEGRLLMTCEDPFGSLDLKKFVKRMDEVYKKGAGEAINLRGEGGAGLGCVIMFEHCEALFLGVIPGLKTLVTCVIPLGMSNRQRAQVKKSLHLVSKENR